MKFIFEQIRTGGDRNFGYLIGDREAKVGALVDPSYQPEVLVKRAEVQGLNIEYIFNTHGHGDHTNGNDRAQELTNAKVAAYQESHVPHDIGLKDVESITLGSYDLKILYTPGHSSDHIVIYIPEYSVAITGDHLFVGKIGGTGSEETSRQQYDSFQYMFRELPNETTIWPGHDYGCRPSSTLALEKATNPFLLAKDFEGFIELKHSWSSFKVEHGLT